MHQLKKRTNPPVKLAVKTVLLVLFCASCASVSNQLSKIARFIDGQDRIEMEGSTAEVSQLAPQDAPELLPEPPPKVETIQEDPKTIKPKPVQITKPEPAPKAPVSRAKIKKAQPAQTRSLSGRVVIQLGQKTKQEKADINASIVRLIPITALAPTTKTREAANSPKAHVIDMKDKAYQPQYLIAEVDETVVFTNSDAIRHNVFSRSGKNAFDLGTFAGGKKRGVTFKEPGIVKVYCNIHPGMATFVSVTEKGISSITDKNGTFSFDNVPAGNYAIEAWNVRGSVSANIDLTDAANHNIELAIENEDPDFEKHKNKFGETYPDKPALFDDEFY